MKWQSDLIGRFQWSAPIANREAKEAVVKEIIGEVRNGDVIGAGSGSTVYLALLALAEKIKNENLHVMVIPASLESAAVCTQLDIPQTTLWDKKPDWTMDGADEVDPEGNLLKGRGGAMFKEKLLICCSSRVYIMVDETKFVRRLGEKFPIPVEVFPGALTYVEERLKKLGATRLEIRPAKGKDGPVISENGNLILDAWFNTIDHDLEGNIKKITGVLESGLFIGYPVQILTTGKE